MFLKLLLQVHLDMTLFCIQCLFSENCLCYLVFKALAIHFSEPAFVVWESFNNFLYIPNDVDENSH